MSLLSTVGLILCPQMKPLASFGIHGDCFTCHISDINMLSCVLLLIKDIDIVDVTSHIQEQSFQKENKNLGSQHLFLI